MLNDPDESVRTMATIALGPGVRFKGIATQGRVGDQKDRVLNALIQALNDPDQGVRAYALASLVWYPDQKAVEPILQALFNNEEGRHHEFLESKAVEALRQIGEPAVEPLTRALNDKDEEKRRKAESALGYIERNK